MLGGAAMLLKREVLDEVGGFDERFEAFSEDVDWALRAQLAGWSSRYVPTALAFHMGSATLGRGLTDFTAYHLWRNAIWMIAKDYPAAALARHAPAIARGAAVNLAAAWWDGKLGVWRRAMRDALAGLPGVLRTRREVQRRRKRGLRELERVIGT
jgi:GT2 family glycosyltransferase